MPQYDQAKRRPGIRKGRERGVWVYVPAEHLEEAGIDTAERAPVWYRVWSRARKGNGNAPGNLLIQWYREP